jgi:hypothetical protein
MENGAILEKESENENCGDAQAIAANGAGTKFLHTLEKPESPCAETSF